MPPAEPFFSVVTPVYNPPIDVLEATIESVRDQTFENWELILVDDASPDPRVRETLHRAAADDDRIRLIERDTNGHIVAASNDGLAAARGRFIALLDHDDLLTPRALAAMRTAIKREPKADYLYSDEDKIDDSGRRFGAFRKPPWSPERLRGQMYTGHLSVLRTSVVRKVGGFREGFDGSQDYDLVLRVTERARRIVHVPRVLYHWRVLSGSVAGDRDAKPYAYAAGQKAIQEHLDRTGIPGKVHMGRIPGTYQIERSLDPEVRVSVVIPTRGGEAVAWGRSRVLVVEAVRSLLRNAGHENLELVVVYDTDTPDRVLEQLREVAGSTSLRLVHYAKPFNYSEKCNLGVVASYGDVVLLLNDDIEVVSPGFVVQLVAPLFEKGVGITGAHLRFPDDSVQHAGLSFYDDVYRHPFRMLPADRHAPFRALEVNRECSGLTGACLAVKRSTYDEVGGLCEDLPVNYNDVDFSLKIAHAGYRRVWITNARAYHLESQTRDPGVHDWEKAFIRSRWRTPKQDVYLPSWKYGGAGKRQRGPGKRTIPAARAQTNP